MMFVHELVDAKAHETPHAIAIQDKNLKVTYRELQERSEFLAKRLRTLGVAFDAPIGLFVQRSADLAIGALGILKAGTSYLPLSPSDPAVRIAAALEKSFCKIVVTHRSVVEHLPKGTWETIVLDEEVSLPSASSGIKPAKEIISDDLAYVIFTSGSTGAPKGAQITHANLLNLIHWHLRAFSVTSSDRGTMQASPGFDAAVWELWPYLVAGATVHIIEDSLRADSRALRDWIVATGITVSFASTAVAESMITLEWPAETRLRFLLTGADVLHSYPPPGLPFTFVNNYGPTECTVVTTSGAVLPQSNPTALPSIGSPIENVQVYVVNEHLQPVPPGVAGELLVGGAGVGRGYLNLSDLTEERFVPDCFSRVDGSRLYRTGDLVRMEPNGQLAFLGRLDRQLKIRGFRIEPAEIEAAIQRHPAIQSSLVVARTAGGGDAVLLGYVATKPESSVNASDLRSFLSTHLPDHMVPGTFVKVSEFRMTANGKVDRSSLPDPSPENTLTGDQFDPPQSEIESTLANFLIRMLGVPRIGRNDNFFRLGGHSLLGAQLIAQIQQTFDVELSLRGLFDHPTVSGIASQIEEQIHAKLNAISEDEARKMLQSLSGEIAV